jgi:FAD:protein FMN transferase
MAAQGPTAVAPALSGRYGAPRRPQAVPVRRMRMALGTWVVIEATAYSAGSALDALESAFARIRHVEDRMHPGREGSDLSHLRALPAGVAAGIDPATWRVLRFAQQLCALSAGVFDPCLPQSPGRIRDLELSPATQMHAPWARPRLPVALDCGGIAKGFAVDLAVEALRHAGCTAGLVNAGGDLRVFGPRPQTLLQRLADGSYAPCELHNAALAVSDVDTANPPPGHRGYYRHDCAARPVRRYAAVRAAEAMVADALTKCALLCAPELAHEVAQELHAQILA